MFRKNTGSGRSGKGVQHVAMKVKKHAPARAMHRLAAAKAHAFKKRPNKAPKQAVGKVVAGNKITTEERNKAREKLLAKNKKVMEDQYKIDSKKVIMDITTNEAVMDYLRKNVSKRTEEVLKALATTKTDEQIAAELDIKINTVRRILNILHGYGVTNYSTVKNSKGWLSFLWSINLKKIDEFYNYVNKDDKISLITNDSDDYFVCEKCYSDNKLIFDFDSAYEAGFKCGACGSSLKRLSRAEAKNLESNREYEGEH